MSYSEGTEFEERSYTMRSTPHSHAADHVLRLFAEWVVRVFLPQIGFQSLSIWMRFELMNQLFDCFLAGVIFLFHCGKRWLLNP